MYPSLMTDLLSVKADLPRTIALAAQHGFGGIDTSSRLLSDPALDRAATRDQMAQANLRPGYVSLSPGRVPVSETDFEAALAELPTVAKNAHTLGFRRPCRTAVPRNARL